MSAPPLPVMPRCGECFKPGWYCNRDAMHTGPCALWPISRLAYREPAAIQSRTDSFMESLCNCAVGIGVSFGANLLILPAVFGVTVSAGQNLLLGTFYTVVSIVRSYTLRRLFNGRSVWAAIKSAFARRLYDGDDYSLNAGRR